MLEDGRGERNVWEKNGDPVGTGNPGDVAFVRITF
jgi:hypothetical protein